MKASEMPLLDFVNEDRKRANQKSYRPHDGSNEVCPCCDAPTVEYRHGLSQKLGEMLLQLFRYGGRARLRDLHLPTTKFNNFQKLQYWGFVAQERKENGRATWYWLLTQRGENFCRSLAREQQYVWTYRGEIVEYEGEAVLISQLVPDYKTRVSFAEEARPRQRNEEKRYGT